ncbi:type II toxin-antitoxin system VapC family toxin [Phenylobacterium sp.]|uniref:type II toxin-antitoxin system VapC family toxin n=1 Tax=Phenylobacterium sp. TaxID=1871053 RepID=UPI002F428D66
MPYLLDTNILSDLVRNPHGMVAARIAEVGEGAVCASVIVAAELRFGAEKKGSPRLSAQLERVLSAVQILPFEEPADRAYAKLRAELEAAGAPIAGNDMLIAAHALSADCVLVTDNEREFRRVAGLKVENWLR